MKLDDSSRALSDRIQPACTLLLFPMRSRIGRIREVATKMLDKTTERHAEHYRRQVTDAMMTNFARLRLAEEEQAAQLEAFWSAVNGEMARQSYTCRNSGDAA
ncbi:MAG: hypothetical protein KDK08_19425 [Rhizobiaceae bacterium]|nr:hypothetical protein [Rhizobiaceae bacterium]